MIGLATVLRVGGTWAGRLRSRWSEKIGGCGYEGEQRTEENAGGIAVHQWRLRRALGMEGVSSLPDVGMAAGKRKAWWCPVLVSLSGHETPQCICCGRKVAQGRRGRLGAPRAFRLPGSDIQTIREGTKSESYLACRLERCAGNALWEGQDCTTRYVWW